MIEGKPKKKVPPNFPGSPQRGGGGGGQQQQADREDRLDFEAARQVAVLNPVAWRPGLKRICRHAKRGVLQLEGAGSLRPILLANTPFLGRVDRFAKLRLFRNHFAT